MKNNYYILAYSSNHNRIKCISIKNKTVHIYNGEIFKFNKFLSDHVIHDFKGFEFYHKIGYDKIEKFHCEEEALKNYYIALKLNSL